MSVERVTRQFKVDDLHPDLYQAVQGFFQSYGLGDPLIETRICCETVTVRQSSSKWTSILEGNLDATFRQALLLTSGWLVWASQGDRSGLVVTGIRLAVLRTQVMVARRSKEFRLEIKGFVEDRRENIRGVLELGSQAAAQNICEKISTAVLEQNPPLPKERRRWFGG
jgi:hypothetical protein